MPNRELQACIVLGGCVLGMIYLGATLLGWQDRIEAPWLWIGGSLIFMAALFWTLLRAEPADERDILINYRSLSLAARIFIFGLMAVMLFSGGGSEGSVKKIVLTCLIATAVATAAGRSLYLYRRSA